MSTNPNVINHRWRFLQRLIEYFECLEQPVGIGTGNPSEIHLHHVICGGPMDTRPVPQDRDQNNVLFYGYGVGARHDENYNKDVAVAGDRIRTSVNDVGEIFIMAPYVILQQRITTSIPEEEACKTLLETASNAHNAMAVSYTHLTLPTICSV